MKQEVAKLVVALKEIRAKVQAQIAPIKLAVRDNDLSEQLGLNTLLELFWKDVVDRMWILVDDEFVRIHDRVVRVVAEMIGSG